MNFLYVSIFHFCIKILYRLFIGYLMVICNSTKFTNIFNFIIIYQTKINKIELYIIQKS